MKIYSNLQIFIGISSTWFDKGWVKDGNKGILLTVYG